MHYPPGMAQKAIRAIAKSISTPEQEREILFNVADYLDSVEAQLRMTNHLLATGTSPAAGSKEVLEQIEMRLRQLEKSSISQVDLEMTVANLLRSWGIPSIQR